MKFFLNIRIVIIAIIFVLSYDSIFQVYENETLFIVQFGKINRQIDTAGIHFKLPLIEDVVKFDKRILQVNLPTKEVIASDQKRLTIDAFVKYNIVNTMTFYETVNNLAGGNARIASILDSSLRQTIATYPFISILNEDRDLIMNKIQTILSEQTKQFGVNIVDVRIIKVDLPTENSEAIFKRMRTDREKEAKELRAEGMEKAQIIRAKADKEVASLISVATMDASNVQGKADAEAIKIYNKSFSKDIEFYKFYKTMEVYKESLPMAKIIMKSNNSFLKKLDINE